MFLWPARSWLRKGLEAGFTVLVELTWPKRRILEVYLNVAEFDEGVFGVEAAARRYWGIGAADVGPQRAARLMAVLPDPKGRSPVSGTATSPAAGRDRERRRHGPGGWPGGLLSRKPARARSRVEFDRGLYANNGASSKEGPRMRRLYHQPLSPFCRKIRLVLAEKKIEVELVEEKPWERRMDFLRLNPAGQVPVLKIDDLVLADSSAIFEYLEETQPDPPLLPKDPALRAEARRLAAWFDDKFHREVTANLLYERVNKKLSKSGYPESENIKAGLTQHQVPPRLHRLADWTTAAGWPATR